RRIEGFASAYELAQAAIARGASLQQVADASPQSADAQSYAQLLADGRVLTPLMHPDPARCLVSGTGLTHLGSASARDAMHQKVAGDEAALSDSMRMFKWGLDGGRPEGSEPGVQPEWFYKGSGHIVAAPGAPLTSPAFALDAGEEPELVGLYVIGPDGTPHRLGFAIGNEFSDHVTERQNYLYLAHSKLRACAVGPELRSGALPADLQGTSRIRRGAEVVWERPFATGEANMCHSLANLEYHHFKYAAHRRPGDVHLHFFGTATLSFSDGVRVAPGDRFEIDLPALGAPLVNALEFEAERFPLRGVHAL
ncbi:MAG TPA: AraD1 family protein, partial [Burkholderiaceae bacterium]|nr:AraD1 family protein [Burkholderiaceae bacterium]